MNIICAICGQSYGNSDEVRVCAHENPQGRWAGSIQSEVLHVESKPPAASPPLTSVPPQEQPYRSRPEHDLFISVGPNVEAWNDNSATAGGYCSCGSWEKYGMSNPTSVLLNWNSHVDEWEL